MSKSMRWILTLFLLPTTVLAAEWPAWRGPEGTGISQDKNLPVEWSATQNIRWKVPLSGAGVSQPVVWGDRIFLTASDERLNDRLHVYCYHRGDGRQLWHTRLFGSAQPEGLFPPGGMAVPTPATDGKHVFALFGTGDLVCLDWQGQPVWIRSLAEEYGPFRNRWGMAASPVLVGDRLIVLVDHWGESYLLAADAGTGANRWKTKRDASVNWTSPLAIKIKDQTQIIVAGPYRVQGYDAGDGTELWTVQGLKMQCIPTPVPWGDVVYAVSGRKGDTLAIRPAGGKGELTNTHVIWKTPRGAPYVPSPLCHDGLYYLVDDEGIATCLEAATGKRLWQERLRGRFHASLVAGDGKVYYAAMDGTVSVVQAGPTFNLLARNKLGEGIVASPALSGRQIFIRGEKHLFCIGENKK
jgi:outer membrane protein assembly factor BamB